MDYAGKCITLIGTASIQDYVFRSNDLKENVGASEIVHDALAMLKRTPPAGCEVIYCGGGNAALLFENRERCAVPFIRQWSFEILKKSPGLRVVVAHQTVGSSLRGAYCDAVEELSHNENLPPFGSELGALPFVKTSPTSGHGGSELSQYGELVSAESESKQSRRNDFDTRLDHDVLRDAFAKTEKPYSIPKEFALLGTVEGASQIAVVHADGNGIGRLFTECVDGAPSDEEFVSRIGSLSDRVTETQLRALRLTLGDLASERVFNALEEQKLVDFDKDLWKNHLLPLRPIVFGGDDLTFVCHGRLGLNLAARYMQRFEEAAQEILRQPLSVCAGVLIIPQKFPFSRAYHMAESLCAQAKEQRRLSADKSGSWLDFQVLLEGGANSMESSRKVLYGGAYRSLLRRPYRLDSSDRAGWQFFETAFRHFFKRKESRWPRSRAKRMLEAIAAGGGEASQLRDAYASRGYVIPEGVDPEDCFDVFEMMDFHCILDWDPEGVREKR